MLKNFLIFACILSCTSFLFGGSSPEKTPDKKKSKSHFVVNADRMEMLVGQIIRLEGNVMIDDEKMVLTSDRMMIFMVTKDDKSVPAAPDNTDPTNNMKIDRIEATGHVKVQTKDSTRSATGDRGTYNKEKDIITLEGNCTIMADGSVMNSNKVVYDRKNDTITSGRATIIIPQDDNKDSGSKGQTKGLDSLFGTQNSPGK